METHQDGPWASPNLGEYQSFTEGHDHVRDVFLEVYGRIEQNPLANLSSDELLVLYGYTPLARAREAVETAKSVDDLIRLRSQEMTELSDAITGVWQVRDQRADIQTITGVSAEDQLGQLAALKDVIVESKSPLQVQLSSVLYNAILRQLPEQEQPGVDTAQVYQKLIESIGAAHDVHAWTVYLRDNPEILRSNDHTVLIKQLRRPNIPATVTLNVLAPRIQGLDQEVLEGCHESFRSFGYRGNDGPSSLSDRLEFISQLESDLLMQKIDRESIKKLFSNVSLDFLLGDQVDRIPSSGANTIDFSSAISWFKEEEQPILIEKLLLEPAIAEAQSQGSFDTIIYNYFSQTINLLGRGDNTQALLQSSLFKNMLFAPASVTDREGNPLNTEVIINFYTALHGFVRDQKSAWRKDKLNLVGVIEAIQGNEDLMEFSRQRAAANRGTSLHDVPMDEYMIQTIGHMISSEQGQGFTDPLQLDDEIFDFYVHFASDEFTDSRTGFLVTDEDTKQRYIKIMRDQKLSEEKVEAFDQNCHLPKAVVASNGHGLPPFAYVSQLLGSKALQED